MKSPAGSDRVYTAAFMEVDGRLVDAMLAETELDAMVVVAPPSVSLDRIRVEMSKNGLRSIYLGPIPTEEVSWLDPVETLEVMHVANEPVELSWTQGSGGDFLRVQYKVFAQDEVFRWLVIAPSDSQGIVFPNLPSTLPGVPRLQGELRFGFARAARVEMPDAEGFEDALAKGVTVRALKQSEMNRYLFENSVSVLSTTSFWSVPIE